MKGNCRGRKNKEKVEQCHCRYMNISKNNICKQGKEETILVTGEWNVYWDTDYESLMKMTEEKIVKGNGMNER